MKSCLNLTLIAAQEYEDGKVYHKIRSKKKVISKKYKTFNIKADSLRIGLRV